MLLAGATVPAPTVVSVPSAASFLPQAAVARSMVTRATARRAVAREAGCSILHTSVRVMGLPSSRERERLAGVDQVGVLDGVLVRLVDLAPLRGVAVLRLGDLREAVARLHRVAAARPGGARDGRVGERGVERRVGARRGGGAAALHVREVGLLLLPVVVLVEDLVQDALGAPRGRNGRTAPPPVDRRGVGVGRVA